MFSSFTVGSRRSVASYSPSSSHHGNKRRRMERPYDRSNDYHYSSKRSNDNQNHRHSREHVTETYDLTTSSSSSRLLPSSSSRKRRAPHSPSPVRPHSNKRHSRSHSPRTFRSGGSPTYYSRSNRAASSSRGRSSTPPPRKKDISDKITDTSLFAELVKDKRKRNKVLQEILDKQEETTVISIGENSNSAITNNNNLITIDNSDNAVMDSISLSTEHTLMQKTNGVKDSSMCLVDIPMPNSSDSHGEKSVSSTLNTTDVSVSAALANAMTLQPPPPPPLESSSVDESPVVLSNNITAVSLKTSANTSGGNTSTIPAVITNNTTIDVIQQTKLIKTSPLPPQQKPIIKATYIITKPKSLTKLPMPPGVNVAELEDISTPSPPRSTSPIIKQLKINSTAPAPKDAGSKASTPASTMKKGLLNLPMPPMVPGSEDLSGDDEYISSPLSLGRTSSGAKSGSAGKKEVKRKRPTILNRRNSRSQTIKDWGERCVDVFEVIAQIGEGTYGQVSNKRKRKYLKSRKLIKINFFSFVILGI